MARPRQKRPPAFLFAVALLRPLLMLLTRRRWSGAEHLVIDGGSVVVANHTSYADPLVVAHYLNDNGIHPNFLGKVEVFQVPVIGALLKAAGQIPVYRDTGQAADAYRAAVAAVNEGRCVTIYPEATLTRDPDLWPMRGKTGAARIALQTRCPVIPVAQWGAEQIIGPYSSRLDLLPRKEVIVRAGPPVDLSDLHERGISRDVLAEATAAHNPDLIVSAGFMKILGPEFLSRFIGRVVNTHPALLPSFPGAHAVPDALAYGVKVTGCTVHLVDAGMDTGPILAQQAVEVLDGDDEETLHERIKIVERRLLVDVLAAVATRGVTWSGRKATIG